MQLSKYQEEILNYFSENKQKNIGVSAFAGTGKTFIIFPPFNGKPELIDDIGKLLHFD